MPILDSASPNDCAGRSPGLLLQPFAWAAQAVLRMARAEPRLLAHLTELDQLRLHAIALYLAYRNGEGSALEDAAFLASARSRDILQKAIGRPPRQLLGLLRRLPNRAFEPDLYKKLVAVAADDEFTRVLMGVRVLTSTEISKLAGVPGHLRTASLLKAVTINIFTLAAIGEVCRWLERKCQIETASHYLNARNLSQVRQVTLDLMRALPPVPPLPPRTLAAARMIETPADLRRAGRVAKNCLGRNTRDLMLNLAAFYIWQDEDEPIYIRIGKPYGLGWFLSQMALAENRAPPDERVAAVEAAFAAAGIEREAVGDALSTLLFDHDQADIDQLRD